MAFMAKKGLTVRQEAVEQAILLIRGQKVMLDRVLAHLYGTSTKVLLQAVKRNLSRFPSDFMYVLTRQEVANMRSQIVTSKEGRGGSRYLPHVFTEQGVAMLSSVLKSERAVQVNIAIMRAFVRLRQILSSNKDLAYKLEELEQKIEKHDEEIHAIFSAIRELMKPLDPSHHKIGFHP